jgi:hypothetical protein
MPKLTWASDLSIFHSVLANYQVRVSLNQEHGPSSWEENSLAIRKSSVAPSHLRTHLSG